MNKKKIIHIVDTLCVGGRENVIIDICNNLDVDKYVVYIITLTNDENVAAIKLSSNVNFFALPIEHQKLVGINTVFSFLFAVSNLKALIKSINPDIIHTHSYLHRLLIEAYAINSLGLKCKCYHTVHTSGMYYDSNRLKDKFKLAVDKLALGLYRPSLIGISELIQNNNVRYFEKQSSRSKYIPNGIDLNLFQRDRYTVLRSDWEIKDHDIAIVYVARLCKGKNHLTLLKAITLVVINYPEVKLFLAGDGEMREEIESFISLNHLQNNVIMLGSIDNVPELLSISDLAVFPSEFEGFTLTLIEKMVMGLPVICADNEIFKKLINHGENGLLFSMFDFEELANCVIRLIEDKFLCSKISINAKLFSEQFSLKRMISSLQYYYDN